MSRIPQHFIDELLARTDIVEVIDARVPLKKKGREYGACCPFHNEKTPSFYVSPAKQFYHCFGCGAHGTAISFLMDYEHLEFPDAVRQLAEHAGVEVPVEAGGKNERSNSTLYEALAEAAAFYQRQLRDTPAAVDYLKGRGLSGDIAAAFGIGYAPAGWDGLSEALRHHDAQNLLAAGLVIRRDNGGQYDRFRERIMFPIRDARGRVIAFGGRVLGKDEPKYLNSPETPLFHKGRELYGLYEARQAARDILRLLVVEGYMDVVALAQHGIPYAVATLGTATTPEHLNRLFRVSEEVVFCFDGDRAGRQAAWRALENALPAVHDGRQIRFLFLPEGEDPDSLVRREGQVAFEARLPAAQPLSEFLFDSLLAQVDVGHLDGRARLVELARPLLARAADPLYRSLLEQKLAGLAQMSPDRLSMLIRTSGSGPSAPDRAARPRPVRGLSMTPMRRAIRLLLEAPPLAARVADPAGLAASGLPGAGLLAELIAYFQAEPAATVARALEHWRDTDEGRVLARLAGQPLTTPAEGLEAEFDGLLANFARSRQDQRVQALLAKGLKALSAEEKAELTALQRRG